MSFELEREGSTKFAKPLARAVLRDSRLSFAARGLYAVLSDLPQNWKIHSEWLASFGPDGRDKVRSLLKELLEAGAIRRDTLKQGKGRVAGTRWVLVPADEWAKAMPLSKGNESRISRTSDFTIVGESAPKVLQGVKVLQDEAACAQVRTATGAAAPQEERKRRSRPKRGDEIVKHAVEIWTCADAEGLKTLVERYGAECVEKVALGLDPAPGHRAPYLSAVLAAFQKRDKAEIEWAENRARRIQLDQAASLDAKRAEQAVIALDNFHSLDSTAQSKLRDSFSEHLSSTNSYVFELFYSKGLKSKLVEAEFVKFLQLQPGEGT